LKTSAPQYFTDHLLSQQIYTSPSATVITLAVLRFSFILKNTLIL